METVSHSHGPSVRSLCAPASSYPCRCLCLGFAQITYTVPRRRTTLHLGQRRFTLGFTFIVPDPPSREPHHGAAAPTYTTMDYAGHRPIPVQRGITCQQKADLACAHFQREREPDPQQQPDYLVRWHGEVKAASPQRVQVNVDPDRTQLTATP